MSTFSKKLAHVNYGKLQFCFLGQFFPCTVFSLCITHTHFRPHSSLRTNVAKTTGLCPLLHPRQQP